MSDPNAFSESEAPLPVAATRKQTEVLFALARALGRAAARSAMDQQTVAPDSFSDDHRQHARV